MATNSRLFRVLFRLGVLSTWILVIGCAKTFYSTELSSEQKALICGYNVPWDRQECLDQANQQIEWCKEALGQEDDCWNTLWVTTRGTERNHRSVIPSISKFFMIRGKLVPYFRSLNDCIQILELLKGCKNALSFVGPSCILLGWDYDHALKLWNS